MLRKVSHDSKTNRRCALFDAYDNTTKYLKLKGKLNRDSFGANIPEEIVSKRFNSLIGTRICLFSKLESYFLKNALLHSVDKKEEEWVLIFRVDEQTFRDDEFFAESPIETSLSTLEELLNDFDNKMEEFHEFVADFKDLIDQATHISRIMKTEKE